MHAQHRAHICKRLSALHAARALPPEREHMHHAAIGGAGQDAGTAAACTCGL